MRLAAVIALAAALMFGACLRYLYIAVHSCRPASQSQLEFKRHAPFL